jgi:hypothetical protein
VLGGVPTCLSFPCYHFNKIRRSQLENKGIMICGSLCGTDVERWPVYRNTVSAGLTTSPQRSQSRPLSTLSCPANK